MSFLTATKPQKSKRSGDRRKKFPFGPFRRVVKNSSRAREYPDALLAARNTYFVDAEHGASVERRPPWVQKKAGGILGGVGTRQGQVVFEHVRVDGTIDRFVFIGGVMYLWDGDTTFTNVTPGAVTISTTARIFCATFNDELIVSDGVNRPWRYNPATTTATYIQVDSAATAWCAFGQPVVHGGALFFVLNTVGGTSYRNKIVWSETLDAATGYMQTGYTDFWTVSQTDTRAIYALASTESALWVFRARSITSIRGTVDRAFTSNANVEALPFAIGTTTPILLFADYIWFFDEMGRPYRLSASGGEPEPLWEQAADGEGAALTSNTFDAVLGYAPDLRLVVMQSYALNTANASATSCFAFNADTGIYNGDWTLCATFGIVALGVCRDSAGFPSLMALGSDGTNFGAVYRMRNAINEAGGSDTDPGAGTSCFIDLHAFPKDSDIEYSFNLAVLRVRPAQSPTTSLRQYSLSVLTTETGGGVNIGTATAPVGRLLQGGTGASIGESPVTWGFNKTARWAQFRFAASTTGEGSSAGLTSSVFSVLGGEVWAVPLGYSPRSR